MIRGKRVPYGQQEEYYWNKLQVEKEFAYISVSGAVVNLILAILFISISFIISNQFVIDVLWRAALINVFLAGFNMLPFGPLDGAKVWRYNPVLWGIVGIPSILPLLYLLK
jgi:Zn-dependent protease